jgi:hypothetical protein
MLCLKDSDPGFSTDLDVFLRDNSSPSTDHIDTPDYASQPSQHASKPKERQVLAQEPSQTPRTTTSSTHTKRSRNVGELDKADKPKRSRTKGKDKENVRVIKDMADAAMLEDDEILGKGNHWSDRTRPSCSSGFWVWMLTSGVLVQRFTIHNKNLQCIYNKVSAESDPLELY